MFSLNSANSVTKRNEESKKKIVGLEPRISCVRDRETLPLSHRATDNRADTYTEPNPCLSDFSDSLNSLNSLNSMKALLHLEKTPMKTVVVRFMVYSRERDQDRYRELDQHNREQWVLVPFPPSRTSVNICYNI